MYADLMDKPSVVFGISGLLLALGVVAVATQGASDLTNPLQRILLSGELLYSLFVAVLIALVIIGWHIDDLPGKCISVAVPLLFGGTIVRLLLPLAQSGGWLGEWNGVMLGVTIVSIYLAWRIQARFALIAIVSSLYAIIVTSGFIFGLVDHITVPTVLGIMAVGAISIVLITLSYFRIKALIRAARRDAIKNHIVMGTMLSIRFTVLSGGAIILLALPFIILAEDSFRSFGLIFLIGSLVSMYTALAAPAPLLMATSDLVISSNPNRKQRKQR
ncbi:MAG: hypothetical protein QF879_18605 [Candidatus Latescibacteria bacterium]|nr:hypothetical protein [Candidatus Latescibacterota bacterium]MDP7238393.1 hypothetical protein [Candidatus Latescibacterota bacterium]